MNSTFYKLSEFFIIFILVPVSFSMAYSSWIKLIIGVLGFAYIIYVLLKVEKEKFNISPNLDWKLFWKKTIVKLVWIAVLTSVFVWYTDKESFYFVMLNKPVKWILLLFIYTFFSVYPQELIYRTFYFKRYQSFFPDVNLFIFINAVIFALAHLFFRSILVLILTFLGGLLFAITYNKTKSTLLVSIEHALYGSWLFTVGMGDMLGFPS